MAQPDAPCADSPLHADSAIYARSTIYPAMPPPAPPAPLLYWLSLGFHSRRLMRCMSSSRGICPIRPCRALFYWLSPGFMSTMNDAMHEFNEVRCMSSMMRCIVPVCLCRRCPPPVFHCRLLGLVRVARPRVHVPSSPSSSVVSVLSAPRPCPMASARPRSRRTRVPIRDASEVMHGFQSGIGHHCPA